MRIRILDFLTEWEIAAGAIKEAAEEAPKVPCDVVLAWWVKPALAL